MLEVVRLDRHVSDLIGHVLGLVAVREPARYDVGSGENRTVLVRNRQRDNEETVCREVFSVAKNETSDVADTESVDQNVAGFDLLLTDNEVGTAEFEHVAVAHDANGVGRPRRFAIPACATR